MQRRSLLWLGALSPLAFFCSRYLSARPWSASRRIDVQGLALQLDQYAANIQTEADAQRLVDFVSDIFVEELPSAWRSASLRRRLAEVEFASLLNSQMLVPESRLCEAWNAYVDTIGAPAEQKATPAEIHNLRDGIFTSARLGWKSSYKNFWAVPSIYATQPDGALAPGCRAIESVRILWDLANMPDNLKAARERVEKGELLSDLFRATKADSPSSRAEVGFSVGRVATNPVQTVTWQYVQVKGRKAWSNAVIAMVDQIIR